MRTAPDKSPDPTTQVGPNTIHLVLTVVVALGAVLLLSWRVRESPELHFAIRAWLVPPLPTSTLLRIGQVNGTIALACCLHPGLRPIGMLLSIPTAFALLLSTGPLPSPLTTASDMVRLLGAESRPRQVWILAAEAAAVVVALLGVVGAAVRSRNKSRRGAEVAHGTARLATSADLREADLLSGEGVVLGSYQTWMSKTPLTDRSADHVLVVMPPGGGKTTGPVAGTLLNVNASALVIDPKGELFNITAAWRQSMGQRIVRFAPQEGSSTPSWNPLDEIEKGPGEIAAISALVDNLVTYPAEVHNRNHWMESARSLLRCLVLHTLYSESSATTLEAVRNLLMSTLSFNELFKDLAKYSHDPDNLWGWTDDAGDSVKTHPEVARLARVFGATPARERGSIISTLARFLDLWGDPRIASATSKSDWSLELFATEPSSVYVTVPTSQLGRLAPLLRLLIALLSHRITSLTDDFFDHEAQDDLPPLYLVLDEFASLGRLPILEDTLAFLRGYGVRCLVVVQDLSQLRRLYGPHHSISATCRIHVAAASSDVATRQEVSRRLGEATHVYRRTSQTGRMLTSKKTISQAEVRRPLLTEGEVGTLSGDQLLVVKAGHPPVLASKLPYYRDENLAERAGQAFTETTQTTPP